MTRDYLINQAPEFLQQLADHAAQVLHEQGDLDAATACELSQAIAARIASVFGGSRVYVPHGTYGRKLTCFELTARDLEIFRQFNGKNRDDICRRYQISKTRLYKIIATVRAHVRARAPRDLRIGLASNTTPSAPTPPRLTARRASE